MSWEKIWNYAQAGNYEKIPANIRIQYYLTLKQIRKDYVESQTEVTCPKCKGICVQSALLITGYWWTMSRMGASYILKISLAL
jgi:hypothetical protein